MRIGGGLLRLGLGVLVTCLIVSGWGAPAARGEDDAEPGFTLLKDGIWIRYDAYGPPVTVGSWTYFAASDGVHGEELWKTDGTAAGTSMVKDIGPNVSRPRNPVRALRRLGDGVVFTIDDGVHGRSVWTSDGTEAGTLFVKDVAPDGVYDPASSDVATFGGDFYFLSRPAIDSEWELWKTDGTEDGTVRAFEGPATFLTETSGALYFGGTGPGGAGHELWRVASPSAVPALVKDINPGPGSSSPAIAAEVGDSVYFAADDGVNGRELWKSDGTAEGTVLVKDLYPSGSAIPYDISAAGVGESLFFTADDGIHGEELWKSDGTAEGTVLVKDIVVQPGYGPNPSVDPRGVVGDRLFFTTSFETQLWATDGTERGTVLVAEGSSGESSTKYGFSDLVAFDGQLYFVGPDNPEVGVELWKSDGTTAGTVVVADRALGPTSSSPAGLTAVAGSLLFADVHGLWRLAPTSPQPASPPNRFVLPTRGKAHKAKGSLALPVALPGPGRLEVAAGRFTKSVTVDTAAAGDVTVLIKPNKAGRKKLRAKLAEARRHGRAARLKVTITMTFTPVGGTPYSVAATYRLRRS